MKKYIICLILFLIVSTACLTAGYMMFRGSQQESAQGVPATELETDTVTADQIVSVQEGVSHEAKGGEYYLVSEDGFLLVFHKDRETISLHTHLLLMEFPESEQDRLREGIWFDSMLEVYNYLESHTS